jgi:Mg2+ and Co2+ transporter CorA
MSYSYRTLTGTSTEQLITEHDQIAVNTNVGVDFYLAELRRREQDQTNKIMVRLTVATAILAALAVVISVISLLVH